VNRLGVPPSRAAHVGDFYHIDVVGARAAGLHAVLLDPAGLYSDADCQGWRHFSNWPTRCRNLTARTSRTRVTEPCRSDWRAGLAAGARG